jgi:outer membrane protein TolC
MTPLFPPSRLCHGDVNHSARGRSGLIWAALLGLVVGNLALSWTPSPSQAAQPPTPSTPKPTPASTPASTPAPKPAPSQTPTQTPTQQLNLGLNQVLEQGMAISRKLVRADRQLARDRALTALNRAMLWPELHLVGLGSYTQVGTSVNLLTNMPTLGDITLSLQQNDYAVLRNTFGNAGVLLDVNLLPLGQLAQLAASRSQEAASRVSRNESERAARFELISTYRQLQLGIPEKSDQPGNLI